MNLIFLTQSKTLALFYDVMRAIRGKAALRNVGFYIADLAFFNEFKKEQPDVCSDSFELLKEWELIEKSDRIKPDIKRLRKYEKMFGDPVLWNALVADRRIYLGRRATLEQDYSSRFSHSRMLSILQTAIEEIEGMVDRVQPDLVIGFICVTIGEYLAYLVAKSRGIPFLNLRPTRIKNYFFAGESVLEPSMRLEGAYQKMLADGIPESLKRKASSYLLETRKNHAMYEGVLPPPPGPRDRVHRKSSHNLIGFLQKFGGLVRRYYNYNFGEYRQDNHQRGVFYPTWFSKVRRPARLKLIDICLRSCYISADRLESLDYVFYPLHKEPEVTLLVYSRPYLNQIEVVRNLARSLPVGMKLLVKEHPAALGYRPVSYYRKLLDIPNVLLVAPEITSRQLVQSACFVTVIAGSVGWEALILRKPLVTLGRVSFNFLPKTMIRHVQDLDRLAWEVCDLLDKYKHDETALVAYISAVINQSVPIDFYSILLGRKGVYHPCGEAENMDTKYRKQIDRLSEYLLGFL